MKRAMQLLVLGASIPVGLSAAAAAVTPQVLVNFDGSLTGTTYNLAVGEIDTTGTMKSNGAASVSGGTGIVNGGDEGFDFDPTSIGTLTATDWVAEAVVAFDAFGGGQLTVIDVQGDTDFRLNTGGSQLEAGYWDGSSFGAVSAPLPATGVNTHLALVWDSVASKLTAYVNGASVGEVDNNAFATPDTSNVSFGYFGRSGFDNRGIDGSLDAVAFSTFSGAFDASNDFQLPVPEPGSLALVAFGGLIAIRRRRA